MPFNKLKKYNQTLDIDSMSESQRNGSLAGIFNRDFINNTNQYNNKLITPTPKNGQTTMEVLFAHLTTKTENNDTNSRHYDRERSARLHWIRHHFMNANNGNLDIFSVKDKGAIRTYFHDYRENYVIIIEPISTDLYYLITAYYINGGNREKIENKKTRRLPDIH
jgi:hypothetical protein